MNIALEQTQEYVGGRVTNSYGDAFIRGNNGVSLVFLSVSFWLTRNSVLYISAAEAL